MCYLLTLFWNKVDSPMASHQGTNDAASTDMKHNVSERADGMAESGVVDLPTPPADIKVDALWQAGREGMLHSMVRSVYDSWFSRMRVP